MKKIFKIISLLMLVGNVPAWAAADRAGQNQKSEAMPAVEQCPVCIEEKALDATLNCGHKFCMPCIKDGYNSDEDECIDGWLYENTTCPMCRASVTKINDEPVTVPFKPSPALAYQFNFAPDIEDRLIVALPYRQQVIDFVRHLNAREYQALLDEFNNEDDSSLEIELSLSPQWVDDTWLPLEQRMALFRYQVGLEDRPENTPTQEEIDARFQQRYNRNREAFNILYTADQFLEDEDLLDPAEHEFDFSRPVFNRDTLRIAPAYYQEIRDFVSSLTPREYTVLYNKFDGKIEEIVAIHPEWTDPTWFTPEIRMEFFRRDLNISGQDFDIELPDIDDEVQQQKTRLRSIVRREA